MPVFQVDIQLCYTGVLPPHCNAFNPLLVQSDIDLCNNAPQLFDSCFDASSLVPYLNINYVNPSDPNPATPDYQDVAACLQDLGCIRFTNCQPRPDIPDGDSSIHLILEYGGPNSPNIVGCNLEITLQSCSNPLNTNTIVFAPNAVPPNLSVGNIVCWEYITCQKPQSNITSCCLTVITINYTLNQITSCLSGTTYNNSLTLTNFSNCESCLNSPQNSYYQVCFTHCEGSTGNGFCDNFRVLCFIFQAPNQYNLCSQLNNMIGANCVNGSFFIPYINPNLHPSISSSVIACFQNSCLTLTSCEVVGIQPSFIHFIVDDDFFNLPPLVRLCSQPVFNLQVSLRNCLNNADVITIIVSTGTNVNVGDVIQIQGIDSDLINLCCYEVYDITIVSQPVTHTITQTFETCNDCVRDRYYEKEPYVKPKPVTWYYPDLDMHCDESKIQDVSCSYSNLMDIQAKVKNYGLGIIKATREHLRNLVYFARFEVIRLKEEALNLCCNFLPCCPPCIINAVENIPRLRCDRVTINGVSDSSRCRPILLDVSVNRCQGMTINGVIVPSCNRLSINEIIIT